MLLADFASLSYATCSLFFLKVRHTKGFQNACAKMHTRKIDETKEQAFQVLSETGLIGFLSRYS